MGWQYDAAKHENVRTPRPMRYGYRLRRSLWTGGAESTTPEERQSAERGLQGAHGLPCDSVAYRISNTLKEPTEVY